MVKGIHYPLNCLHHMIYAPLGHQLTINYQLFESFIIRVFVPRRPVAIIDVSDYISDRLCVGLCINNATLPTSHHYIDIVTHIQCIGYCFVT